MKSKPVIFSDIIFTPYEQYMVFEDGTIDVGTCSNLPPIKMIHSSNGNDYVCLKTNESKSKLYKLDVLIIVAFKPEELYKNSIHDKFGKKHFKIIHLDGNLSNNSIDNLKVEKDYEEWKPLIQPDDIVKGMYEISSWGRVHNLKTNTMLTIGMSDDGYPQVSLQCMNDNGKICTRPKRLHRLIALHFIPNPNPDEFNVLDHINGDKLDYSISNLHWVTQKINVQLGLKYGSRARISTAEIDFIIYLLLELKGSIRAVYNSIDHSKFPYLTEAVINNIKQKDPAYIRMDGKYDLKNIEFEKRTRKADLTDNEIEEICKALVECKFDIDKTLNLLHFNGLEHIARHDVRHIRNKSKRCDISDKYFSRDDYEHPKAAMTDDVVVLICKALIKYDGNIAKVTKEMNSMGHTEINKFQVQDVKYKKRSASISDEFFTYENKEFKAL